MGSTMSFTDLSAPAAAPAAGGADLIKDTTTQTFAADVVEESKRQPVLVDFWAPWCGPCRTLSPIIEKAVRAAGGAVRLVKMNIDEHPAVAGQLGIQSIPAVIAFSNGQAVDGFVGALPESQVKAFIERVAGPAGPSDAALLVEEGNRLLETGDLAGAAEHFAAALKSEPQSAPATAGLAGCHLARGDLDAARSTLATLPDSAANDPAVAGVRAQLDLAAQTAGLGDPAALAARIAANPLDHQARFDLALLLNAEGDREGATDRLLEIIAKDRSWNDEQARKQLVQFFEAWGPTDEATLAGRRRLSALLFA
jgi:putative thioredoxin